MAKIKSEAGTDHGGSSAPQRRSSRARRMLKVVIPVLTVGVLAAVGVILLVRSGDEAGGAAPAGSIQSGTVTSGQAVQPFTLMNQFGEPVTVTPGDGENYLLVFYMGYF